MTVRGEEQGFRLTVVLLEPEKVGDISDISEQPFRQLATFVSVARCSPTRERQRPLPRGGGHQAHVEVVGHQHAVPRPGGRSLHETCLRVVRAPTPAHLEMSDGSGREVELAHQRHHPVDVHALAGSAVDHHRLRWAVEDPHCVGESNVVTGDDGEGASDVRVAPDGAPHDDRAKSGKRSDGTRRKLKLIDEAQVVRPVFGPDERIFRAGRPARWSIPATLKKDKLHSSLTDRCMCADRIQLNINPETSQPVITGIPQR